MVVVVLGGLEQFSVSPRPLGFGFGTKGFGAKGLGPGLDNLLSYKSWMIQNFCMLIMLLCTQLKQLKVCIKNFISTNVRLKNLPELHLTLTLT